MLALLLDLLDVFFTVLLGACVFGGGFCGCDALAGLFGDGDHEVVDFLEVEVGHDGKLSSVRRREVWEKMTALRIVNKFGRSFVSRDSYKRHGQEATPRWGTVVSIEICRYRHVEN